MLHSETFAFIHFVQVDLNHQCVQLVLIEPMECWLIERGDMS